MGEGYRSPAPDWRSSPASRPMRAARLGRPPSLAWRGEDGGAGAANRRARLASAPAPRVGHRHVRRGLGWRVSQGTRGPLRPRFRGSRISRPARRLRQVRRADRHGTVQPGWPRRLPGPRPRVSPQPAGQRLGTNRHRRRGGLIARRRNLRQVRLLRGPRCGRDPGRRPCATLGAILRPRRQRLCRNLRQPALGRRDDRHLRRDRLARLGSSPTKAVLSGAIDNGRTARTDRKGEGETGRQRHRAPHCQ